MQLITGVIIILIVIVIIATSGYYYILSTSNKLHNLLQKMGHNITENNWDDVKQINHQLNKKWNSARNIFPIMVNHAELHDLEITLTRISSLIQQKNENKLLSEIAVAKRLARNIYEQEKFSLENIF